MPAQLGVQLSPPTELDGWKSVVESAELPVAYLETAVAQLAHTGNGTVSVYNIGQRVKDRGGKARLNERLKSVSRSHFPRAAKQPDTALFEQARLYTFLPYREGLSRALVNFPHTSEQAVHAYVRVVLVWAKSWPSLTHATKEERDRDAALQRKADFSFDKKVNTRLNTVGIPHIAAQDLTDLMLTHRRLEPTAHEIAERAVAELLVDQTLGAIWMMRRDPSLHVLSAYNYVRAQANAHLGGALARLHITEEEVRSVDAEIHQLLFEDGLGTLSPQAREELFLRRPTLAIMFKRLGGSDND